jgi:chromosome segregation and condensation protein ScpB
MHKIKKWNKWLFCLLTIFLLIIFAGCKSTGMKAPADSSSTSISIEDTDANQIQKDRTTNETDSTIVQVEKGLSYSTKDEVAAYIHEFLALLPNYITKKEA